MHHHHCWDHESHAAGRRGFRGPPVHGPGGFGPAFRGGPGGPFRAGRMFGDAFSDVETVELGAVAR